MLWYSILMRIKQQDLSSRTYTSKTYAVKPKLHQTVCVSEGLSVCLTGTLAKHSLGRLIYLRAYGSLSLSSTNRLHSLGQLDTQWSSVILSQYPMHLLPQSFWKLLKSRLIISSGFYHHLNFSSTSSESMRRQEDIGLR